jgi:MFS family permease
VWLIGLIYFCAYSVFNVLLVHMVVYARGQGIPAERAVAIISAIGLGSIGGRITMGIVADRIGNKKEMALSTGLMILALFALLATKDVWMLYLVGVAFGFGQGGVAIMESPIVAHIFGMRSHGSILGLVFFCDTVGGATGPFLAGYLFDVTRSYNPAFLFCGLQGVVTLIAILLLRPVQRLQRTA